MDKGQTASDAGCTHGLVRATILLCTLLLICNTGVQVVSAQSMETVAKRDKTTIAEAYHLWQTLGEQVWPGWTEALMPVVYVGGEYEFAVGFTAPPEGFERVNEEVAGRSVSVRRRQLEPTLAAAYDFQGTPAVVIGAPDSLGWSPSQWTLKAVHEMFHVLSMQRGLAEKVRALKIGPEDDATWQLEFPFPYENVDVMRLMHLQGYTLYNAITSQGNESSVKYDAGTSLEALEVLGSYLRNTTGDDRAARYAAFQEGEEGAGRYTEYRMAQLAAGDGYEPHPDFSALPGFVSYAKVWDETYASSLFVIKHAGRAVKTRTLFYYLGLGKCLLLDRLDPDWKHGYFAPDVWLDDLIAAAVGSKTTLAPIGSGAAAPSFRLGSLNGDPIDLAGLRDKVVLLDFWQWWCPPCIEAMPHLQELSEKYRSQGLVVLGISDRVDEAARRQMAALAGKTEASYPMLVDPTGAVARDYGVNRYPTLVLIDRQGIVRWVDSGKLFGEVDDVERSVIEALAP